MEIDKKYKITKCCSREKNRFGDYERPALAGVYIDGDYAVATDSYKLAKVKVQFNDDKDAFNGKILNPTMVEQSQKQKQLPTINDDGERGIWVGENTYLQPFIEEKFPPYQKLMDDTDQADKVYSVKLNAKNLYELSQALGHEEVYLYFREEAKKPIKVVVDCEAKGILMPCSGSMGINWDAINNIIERKEKEEQENVDKEKSDDRG